MARMVHGVWASDISFKHDVVHYTPVMDGTQPSACGLKFSFRRMDSTKEPVRVTCKNCLRAMARQDRFVVVRGA